MGMGTCLRNISKRIYKMDDFEAKFNKRDFAAINVEIDGRHGGAENLTELLRSADRPIEIISLHRETMGGYFTFGLHKASKEIMDELTGDDSKYIQCSSEQDIIEKAFEYMRGACAWYGDHEYLMLRAARLGINFYRERKDTSNEKV